MRSEHEHGQESPLMNKKGLRHFRDNEAWTRARAGEPSLMNKKGLIKAHALVSPYGDLAELKLNYWLTIEIKNSKKIANPQEFSAESFVFSYISLKIQPLYCFRGKMCKKLEKWDPLNGLITQSEIRKCKNMAFTVPTHGGWVSRRALIWIILSAVDQ